MPYRRFYEHHDPLSAVPPSKHPYQFWAVAALFITGWSTVDGTRPGSIHHLLPPWAALFWSVLLIVGSTVILLGTWWHDRITGLLMERIGHLCVAVSCISYGISLAWATGMTAIGAILLVVGVGIAAAWRVRHVTKELHKLRWFMASVGLTDNTRGGVVDSEEVSDPSEPGGGV